MPIALMLLWLNHFRQSWKKFEKQNVSKIVLGTDSIEFQMNAKMKRIKKNIEILDKFNFIFRQIKLEGESW